MRIEIPNKDYQTLASHAAAVGYPNVAAYVIALADVSSLDPRGPLTDGKLAASVAMLNESFADEAAGWTKELQSAFGDIASRRGIPFNQ